MKVDEAIKRALRAGEEEDRELKLAAYILAIEYTQLRAKLPKTADGVPVVPGMEIWYLDTDGPQRSRIGESEFRKFDDCYSSREAAETAKQES